MIDWHHPRIYERLRCFGLCLFILGVASHNVDNPPAALAAIVVAMLLIVRLRTELDIKRDEEEHSLGTKGSAHSADQHNRLGASLHRNCRFSAASGERAGHCAFSQLEWTNEKLGQMRVSEGDNIVFR